MGSMDRREREKAELQEKILNAARELFVVYGYEGVSMRRIAERIEYSPTAIYLHFADKEALFRELCNADFRRLAAEFAQLAKIADPSERLRQVGRAYVSFGAAHPFHYRLMFMTQPPVPHCGNEAEMAAKGKGNPEQDAYALLRWSVEEAMHAGQLREELTDVELVSQTLWAAVHGVTALEVSQAKDGWTPWRPLAARTEAMLDMVMRGLWRRES